MRRLLFRVMIVVCMLGVGARALAQSDTLRLDAAQRWEAANKLYIEGEYEAAAHHYEEIVAEGLSSPKLYYNMGNAYFKQGEVGRAILYYNRALKLAPGNEDVRHNLALAEAQTKDRITAVPKFFLAEWMEVVRHTMSCTAWSILSVVCFAVLVVAVLLFLVARALRLRKAGFFVGIVALLLFVLTVSFAVAERREILSHDEAIVLASAISVKSSPDCSSTDLFVLHEGAKVHILTRVDEWYEVVIADGKRGWVESRNVEQI